MILTLHLGVSYKCNMKCKHCFVEKKVDAISLDNIMNIIKTLSEKGLFMVYYTFGEPTLSEMWLSVAEKVKEMGLVQILMSNGYLIDDQMADRIKKAGISRVMISIDHSVPAHHDKNRGVIGAHRKAINAINTLKKHNIPVGIATTITSHNADVISDIYNLAIALNVGSISFLRERNHGHIVEQGFESYYAFFDDYIKQERHAVSVQFHDPMLLRRIESAYTKGIISPDSYDKWQEMNCCHCQSTLAIAPNGDFMRCNLSEHILGNICDPNFNPVILEEGGKNEHFICCTVFSR